MLPVAAPFWDTTGGVQFSGWWCYLVELVDSTQFFKGTSEKRILPGMAQWVDTNIGDVRVLECDVVSCVSSKRTSW